MTPITGKTLDRLFAKDASLFSEDPETRQAIGNRLGWLHAPEEMAAEIEELTAFRDELLAEGFTHALLMGMGGSSLAPALFADLFRDGEGLELSVLDSTAPAAVAACRDSLPIDKTLFIVATKSGGTKETLSFFDYFRNLVPKPSSFVAVTDPGSPLAEHPRFRRIFLNPPDIGGRYSALSLFGLLPAALRGADVGAIVESAIEEERLSKSVDSPAFRLGEAMGNAAAASRNKLTLVTSPSLALFGAWVEQLVAESTGKRGVGILPVDGERLGTPDVYGDDRLFLFFGLAGEPPPSELEALDAAGFPVSRQVISCREKVGALLFRMEMATALASIPLAINPFNEPNVSESKKKTADLLERYSRDGTLPDPGHSDFSDLAPFIDSAERNGYIAILAYCRETAERLDSLRTLQAAMRDRTRLAVTVGFGPRYLHSTGQLHKGGPKNGSFLILLTDALPPEGAIEIPQSEITFGTLMAAQAAGDIEVLRDRGRQLLVLSLGDNPGETLASLAPLVSPGPDS